MTSSRITGSSVAVATIGVLAIVVCGAGVAVASNGGSLVLGHSNSATKVTSLTNRAGTALALHAGHGKAPLSVNNSTQVKRLNASLLGGSTAKQLKTSGSAAATNFPSTLYAKIGTTWTALSSTAKLAAGTYYATASVMLALPADDSFDVCRLSTTKPSESTTDFQSAFFEPGNSGTISETEPLTVKAGQRISFYCEVHGTDSSGGAYNDALTAIRVDSSAKGTVPTGLPVP